MTKSQWRDLTTKMPQRHRDTERKTRKSSAPLCLCGKSFSVETTSLISDSRKPIPAMMIMSPREVAELGCAACLKGETICVPGAANRLLATGAPLLPPIDDRLPIAAYGHPDHLRDQKIILTI